MNVEWATTRIVNTYNVTRIHHHLFHVNVNYSTNSDVGFMSYVYYVCVTHLVTTNSRFCWIILKL